MNRIDWTYYKTGHKESFNDSVVDYDDDDDEDDIPESEYNHSNNMNSNPGMGKLSFPNELVSTPIGYMMAASGWNPLANRIMYIANTNFVLTEENIKLISIVPGIEHITVLSPYSFVIIIGILFDDNTVIQEIETVLNVVHINVDDYIDNDSPLADILKPILKKLSESNYWMIYVFPNGKVLEKTYETKDELQEDLKIYDEQEEGKNLCDYSNGILLSNLNK